MKLTMNIDGVDVHIKTKPVPKSIWYEAEWKCTKCGMTGRIYAYEKQNTDAGAFSAAQGRAKKHIQDMHQKIE